MAGERTGSDRRRLDIRDRKPRLLSREDLGELLEAGGWGELPRTDEDLAEAIAIDRVSKIVRAGKIVLGAPTAWCMRCDVTWRSRARVHRRPAVLALHEVTDGVRALFRLKKQALARTPGQPDSVLPKSFPVRRIAHAA